MGGFYFIINMCSVALESYLYLVYANLSLHSLIYSHEPKSNRLVTCSVYFFVLQTLILLASNYVEYGTEDYVRGGIAVAVVTCKRKNEK
jgi:hypothetical protein